MKSLLHFLLGVIAIVSIPVTISAQKANERLSGEWVLQTEANTETAETFLTLYFFDDNVGVCSTTEGNTEFRHINCKGNYQVDNNTLQITLNKSQGPAEYRFTYSLDGEQLILNDRFIYTKK